MNTAYRKCAAAPVLLGLLLLTTLFTAGCEQPQSKPEEAEPAAARPPAEATSQEPAQKTKKAELTVLWGARTADGVVEIELSDLNDAETKQIKALFEKTDDTDSKLAYDPSKMPERFHDVESAEVLSPNGLVEVGIDSLVRHQGPSRAHYWLRTKETAPLPDKLAWTLAAPAGQMADTASMRLVDAKPVHLKASPKLREAFLGALSADEQKRVAEKLDVEHILGVSARFPAPHSQIVTINVLGKQHMPLAQAVFVADDTGNVTATIKEPFVGPLGDMTLLAVADPDADGVDGVLYRQDTDGYFIYWLHFDENGEPVVDTLAGFSA